MKNFHTPSGVGCSSDDHPVPGAEGALGTGGVLDGHIHHTASDPTATTVTAVTIPRRCDMNHTRTLGINSARIVAKPSKPSNITRSADITFHINNLLLRCCGC